MPSSEESWAGDSLQEEPVSVEEKGRRYVPVMENGSQGPYMAGEKRPGDPSDVENIPNKRHRGDYSTDASRSFPGPGSAIHRAYLEETDDGYHKEARGCSQITRLGISYLPEHKNGSNIRQHNMESRPPYNISTPPNGNTQYSADPTASFRHFSGGSTQILDFRAEQLPQRSQNSFEMDYLAHAPRQEGSGDEYFGVSPPFQRISMESSAPLYQRNSRRMEPETQWDFDEKPIDRRQGSKDTCQSSRRQHEATGRIIDPEIRYRLNEKWTGCQQGPTRSYHGKDRQYQNNRHGTVPEIQWRTEDEGFGPYRLGQTSHEELRSGHRIISQSGEPVRNMACYFINPGQGPRSESRSRVYDMGLAGPSHTRSDSFGSIDTPSMGPRSDEAYQNLIPQNGRLFKTLRAEEITTLPKTPPSSEIQARVLPASRNSRETYRNESPVSSLQHSARSDSVAPVDRTRPDYNSIDKFYPPTSKIFRQETRARDEYTIPEILKPPLRGQFFNASSAPHDLDSSSQGGGPDLLRQREKESNSNGCAYDDMVGGRNAAGSPCPTIDLSEYFRMSRKNQQSQVSVDSTLYSASKVLPAESIHFGERVKTLETPIRNQQHLARRGQESPVDLLIPPAKAVIKSVPMKDRITLAQSKATPKKRQPKKAAFSESEQCATPKAKAAAKKTAYVHNPKSPPKLKKAPAKNAVDLELEKQQRAARLIVSQEQKAEMKEVERMIFGEIISDDFEDDEAVIELQRQKREEERQRAKLMKEELREAAEREKVALREWEAEQAAKRKVVEEQELQAKKARWEVRRKELYAIEEERKEENRRRAQEQIEASRQKESAEREAKEREKQKAIDIQNEAKKLAAAEIEKAKKEVAKLQAASLKPATKHSTEPKKHSEAPQNPADDEDSLFISQPNSINGDVSDVIDVDLRNGAKSLRSAAETSRKSFLDARAEWEAQQKAEADKKRAEDLKAKLEARYAPIPVTKMSPSRKGQSNETENVAKGEIYPGSELKEIIAAFPTAQKPKVTPAAPSLTPKATAVEELPKNKFESVASVGSPITTKPEVVANVLQVHALQRPASDVTPDITQPELVITEAQSSNIPECQPTNQAPTPSIEARPNEHPIQVPKQRTRKLYTECRSRTVRPGSKSCDQCIEGIPCFPKGGQTPWGSEYYKSCAECQRNNLGCLFQSGSQACDNCVSRSILCVPKLKIDLPQDKPNNTPQAKTHPLETPPPLPPPLRSYPSAVKTVIDVQRENKEAQSKVAKQKAALAKQREAFEKKQQRWKNDEEKYAKNQRARILLEAKEKGVEISEAEVRKRVEVKLKNREENYQRKIAKQKAELGLGAALSGTGSQSQSFLQTQSQSSGKYRNDDFEKEPTPPLTQLTESDAESDAACGTDADHSLTEEEKARKESAEDMKRALRALRARNGSRFAQAAAKTSVAHFQEDSEESEEDPDDEPTSLRKNRNADDGEESESDEDGVDDTNAPRAKKGEAANGLNPDDFGTQIDELFEDIQIADTQNNGQVEELSAPAKPLISRMIRLYIVQRTNSIDSEEQPPQILQKFTNRDDANSFAASMFQEVKGNKAENEAIAEKYENNLFHGSLISEENGTSTTIKVTTEIIQDSSTLAIFDPDLIQPRISEYTYFVKLKTSTEIQDEETKTTTITNKEEILPPPHYYSDLELANYAACAYFYTYLKPPRAKIDWIAQHENEIGKLLRSGRDTFCEQGLRFDAELERQEGQVEWLEEKIVGVEVVRYEIKGPLN